MEVLTVQNQFGDQHYNDIAASRMRSWSKSVSSNAQELQQQHQQRQRHLHHHHHHHHHNNHHHHHQQQTQQQPQHHAAADDQIDCDNVDMAAVNELSERLLAELRAAKTGHLTCAEVSLPSDLTQRIAHDIVCVSEREPCGVRGCTIFVEYEEEPNNLKRIAKLSVDPEMVSTFEVYLTLRQDKRGWTSLLPQIFKGLSRTITISPDYTLNKRKLYSHDSN